MTFPVILGYLTRHLLSNVPGPNMSETGSGIVTAVISLLCPPFTLLFPDSDLLAAELLVLSALLVAITHSW